MRGGKVWVLLTVTFFVTGHAAQTPPSGQTVAPVAASPASGRLIGGVEFRPSYRGTNGEFYTENGATLGYRFASGLSLAYKQEFNTNLSSPNPAVSGLDPYAFDGSFRAKVGNLWADREAGLALSYEGRAYLPTHAPKREAGMVTSLRNYFRLRKTLSSSLALQLEEVLIPHFYSRSGSGTGARSRANPAFENRVYFDVEYQLPVRGLKLFFPLILNSVRYRDYVATAPSNDSWGHKLWIYPELTYEVNSNLTLGIAFYSDNFIKPDFSGFTLSEGFRRGIAQVILSALM